jgi:hypothetical protein
MRHAPRCGSEVFGRCDPFGEVHDDAKPGMYGSAAGWGSLAGTVTGSLASSAAMRATLRFVLVGSVGVAEDDVVDALGLQIGGAGQ